MEENKGFWYADWSFPIFVGLLSSGVSPGRICTICTASAHLTKSLLWRC